jgi:hypothetical protein
MGARGYLPHQGNGRGQSVMTTNGKVTRRQASQDRRAALWAQRIRDAEGPQQQAEVEWGWLRSEIKKVARAGGEGWAESWEIVSRHLSVALMEIREADEKRHKANPCPSSRPDPAGVRLVRAMSGTGR